MMKPHPWIKQERIVVKAKNPRRVKAALKKWAAQMEEADADPWKLNEAPPWAENALLEAVKIVFPSGRLPTAGEWDLEFLGELFGRLEAVGKLYDGEIPMGPETKAECDLVQRKFTSQLQSPANMAKAKEFAKYFQTATKLTNRAIPLLTVWSLDSSHGDALKFQKGLARGMNLEPDELTTPKTFQRHTRTFWVLGVRWRAFAQCRSVAEVHRKLCDEIGEEKIGSLKTFENRVAKKIGMKFRQSGRPRKSR